jgi:hypothetical protein
MEENSVETVALMEAKKRTTGEKLLNFNLFKKRLTDH